MNEKNGMWVCEECGEFHESPDDICCGRQVVSMDEAFSFQLRLFDSTGEDKAASVLKELRDSYESSCATLQKAREKLVSAEVEKDRRGKVLIDFYKLTLTKSEVGDE